MNNLWFKILFIAFVIYMLLFSIAIAKLTKDTNNKVQILSNIDWAFILSN